METNKCTDALGGKELGMQTNTNTSEISGLSKPRAAQVSSISKREIGPSDRRETGK